MNQTPPAEVPRPRWKVLAARALYIVAAAAAVYLLGAGTVYFVSTRPLAERTRALTSALESAQDELSRLRPLTAENAQLKEDVAQIELQALALQALASVNDARVAMALGNAAEARMPIVLADGVLARLAGLVDDEQAQEISAMRDRLALARGEFETDAFAAQRDLEVLANDLTQLAKQLTRE